MRVIGERSLEAVAASCLPPRYAACLYLGMLVATAWLMPQDAKANCGAGLPESLEVLPADGTVVPSDIRNVYVYPKWGGFGVELVLESDGATYPVSGWLAALPEGLQPGDVFEYSIIATIASQYAWSRDPSTLTKRFGPYSFTVGDAPAAEPAQPSGALHHVGGTATRCETEVSSPGCESDMPDESLDFPIPRFRKADCYDVGIASYFVVELDENPSHSLVEVTFDERWPSFFSFGCSRFMYSPECSETICVQAIPFDQALRPRPDQASEICWLTTEIAMQGAGGQSAVEAREVSIDEGEDDASTANSGGGCTIVRVQDGGLSPFVMFLALVLFAAVRGRRGRRKRHAVRSKCLGARSRDLAASL